MSEKNKAVFSPAYLAPFITACNIDVKSTAPWGEDSSSVTRIWWKFSNRCGCHRAAILRFMLTFHHLPSHTTKKLALRLIHFWNHTQSYEDQGGSGSQEGMKHSYVEQDRTFLRPANLQLASFPQRLFSAKPSACGFHWLILSCLIADPLFLVRTPSTRGLSSGHGLLRDLVQTPLQWQLQHKNADTKRNAHLGMLQLLFLHLSLSGRQIWLPGDILLGHQQGIRGTKHIIYCKLKSQRFHSKLECNGVYLFIPFPLQNNNFTAKSAV